MKGKNILKKVSAVLLALTMVIPGVYLGETSEREVKAAGVAAEDVQKEMLDVKVQVATDDSNKMRFVSSVDCLDYSSVGFEVTPAGGNKMTYTTSTVYERIVSTDNSVKYQFSPKVVSTESEYFVTAKLKATAGVDYTVRAFVVTMDGDTVYGASRCVAVSDGQKDTPLNLSFASTTKVESGTKLTATYGSTDATAEATVISCDGETVHVRVDVDKEALPSATLFTFTGAATGSVISRNLYTEYSGTADATWYTVYKAAGKTKFVVATNADLYGIPAISDAATVNTFEGETIYQVADITANVGTASATGWTKAETNGTEYTWEPIGAYTGTNSDFSKSFAGTYDGQGHTISGLYVSQSTVNGVGMFAQTSDKAVIRNFTITNSYIQGKDDTGAVVGRGGGTFEEIYTEAFVVGTGFVGGIVGLSQIYPAKISSCWNAGTINGTNGYAGGMIGGGLVADCKIEHCLNTGMISGGAYRGGLCGGVTEVITMKDSLTVGSLSGSGRAGSVLGGSPVPDLFPVSSSTITAVEGFVFENVYAKAGINDAEIGHAVKHNYPTLGKVDEANLLGTNAYSNTWLTFDRPETKDMSEGYWAIRTNNQIPIPKCFAEDTDYASLNGIHRVDTTWYDADATVHYISSADELLGLSSIVDAGTDTFAGDTVYLTADIIMNQGDATQWAGGTSVDGLYMWTPIGVCDEIAFEGTFDGGGHCLSGFYYKGSELKSVGLFTEITTDTVIKNFSIVNSYFENNHQSYGGVGAVVGIANGVKLIDTVYSEAIIKSTYSASKGYTGGIVGCMAGSAGTIQNCWNVGDVTSTGNYVGGILGINLKQGTVITNCINTGVISANATAGNILGTTTESLTLNQCLAIGETNSTTGNGRGAISGTGYKKGITMNDVYYIGTVGVDETIGKHEVGDSAEDTAAVSVSAEEAAASGIAVLNTNANWYWEAGFDYPVLNAFKDKAN